MAKSKPLPQGILYFFEGQLLYETRSATGRVSRKCISPHDARLAFVNQPIDSGWLHPATIRLGTNNQGNWILQRYAPREYHLLLSEPVTLPGAAHPCSRLTVPLPGFLFLGCHTQYFIWAYRKWNGEKTKLYHAPLPNVWTNGNICFGSAAIPETSAETIDKAWELMWSSAFNHDLATEKSKAHPGDIYEQLIAVHQAHSLHSITYPNQDLMPSPMTIPEILHALNRPSSHSAPLEGAA